MNFTFKSNKNVKPQISLEQFINYYKGGGAIHIKKENRGKFTDYCGGKVTESCISQGKNSSSSAVRKRAVFAENARKWKHAKGGKTHMTVSVLDGTKNVDPKTLKLRKHQQGGNIEKYLMKYTPIETTDIEPWVDENPLAIVNSVELPPAPKKSRAQEETEQETPYSITWEDYDRDTTSKKYTPSKKYQGLDEFNKAFDEVVAEDNSASKYRDFLTRIAEKESGFNSYIQNQAGAPAYGYFQFMQDGNRYNNITTYAGTDVETFRNNPKLQIKAAIKLAKDFEKGFSKQDLEEAKKKGYSMNGLLAGAWLGGVEGVRRYLYGMGDPSDKHWSSSGAGTTVGTRIREFNT